MPCAVSQPQRSSALGKGFLREIYPFGCHREKGGKTTRRLSCTLFPSPRHVALERSINVTAGSIATIRRSFLVLTGKMFDFSPALSREKLDLTNCSERALWRLCAYQTSVGASSCLFLSVKIPPYSISPTHVTSMPKAVLPSIILFYPLLP